MREQTPHVDVLGVSVTAFRNRDHALDVMRTSVMDGTQLTCVAINPEKIESALSQENMRSLVSEFEVRICDGVGISLASVLLNGEWLPRVTGCDLATDVLKFSEQQHFRVFLLGGTLESNRLAREEVARRHPQLQVAGRDGYFEDSAEIVAAINSHQADILLVGLGSPRQEQWIQNQRRNLDAKFLMGVGGTIDVLSGTATRAPALVRRLGLEFLYRLIRNPSRIRRQLVLPKFAFRVATTAFFRLLSSHKKMVRTPTGASAKSQT